MTESDDWWHVSHDGPACTVTLRGELDLARSGDLTATLTGLHERGGISIVRVDLTEVGFLDSTAIGSLIAGYHAARAAGAAYVADGMRGQVEQVLELTGLLPVLRGVPG